MYQSSGKLRKFGIACPHADNGIARLGGATPGDSMLSAWRKVGPELMENPDLAEEIMMSSLSRGSKGWQQGRRLGGWLGGVAGTGLGAYYGASER